MIIKTKLAVYHRYINNEFLNKKPNSVCYYALLDFYLRQSQIHECMTLLWSYTLGA